MRRPLVALALAALLVAVAVPAPWLAATATAEGGDEAEPVPTTATLNYADYLAEEQEAAGYGEPSLGSVLLGLAWKLGLVVVLVYGVLWVMKRFMVVKAAGGGQQLQVVESISLGANRSLHLLRVGSQVLLIGTTAQEVRSLGDVTEAVLPAEADAWAQTSEEAPVRADRPEVRLPERPSLLPSYETVRRIRRLWNGSGL